MSWYACTVLSLIASLVLAHRTCTSSGVHYSKRSQLRVSLHLASRGLFEWNGASSRSGDPRGAATYVQKFREQMQHPPIHALIPSRAVIPANLLHLLLLGPPADRPLEAHLRDLLESSSPHCCCHGVDHAQRLAPLVCCLDRQGSPLLKGRARDAAVFTLRPNVDFHLFIPAARLERLHHFGVEFWVIVHAAEDLARVDHVKAGGGVRPRVAEVVDFKRHIGRYKGRLNWGEVVANNRGGGIAVAHIDGPDAGAGADVEDAAGEFGEGSEV